MAANALLPLWGDDPLIRMNLEKTLEEAGSDTVVAANGRQAVAELEADAVRFRAVVTDIRLGHGPDGWEVARRVRELVPDMPVVYVSSERRAEQPHGG